MTTFFNTFLGGEDKSSSLLIDRVNGLCWSGVIYYISKWNVHLVEVKTLYTKHNFLKLLEFKLRVFRNLPTDKFVFESD